MGDNGAAIAPTLGGLLTLCVGTAVTADDTCGQTLTGSDVIGGQLYGLSVAVDGDVAVLSAPLDDELGQNAGAAYVFRHEDGLWYEQAKLTAGDGLAEDWFGYPVAIQGDVLLLGAMGRGNSGAAYVFRYEPGSTQWVETAVLTSNDEDLDEAFGSAVDLDGSTAIVGSRYDHDLAPWGGSVYVFQETDGRWDQVAELTPEIPSSGASFGAAAAISGDHIVVGAPWTDTWGDAAGAAYIFERGPDDEAWAQVEALAPTNPVDEGLFGVAVAADGSRVLIAEPGPGTARMYRRLPGTWIAESVLPTPPSSDGAAVTLAAGLAGVAAGSGGATLFRFNGLAWTPQPLVETSFVGGLSTDGDTVLLGQYPDYDAGRIFRLADPFHDCNQNTIIDACDIAAGDLTDCDGNGLGDECLIELLPELDCNGNGVLDACDISPQLDLNNNGVLDECEGCFTDLSGNGFVDTADFLIVIGAWSKGQSYADVTGDGIVDVQDLLAILATWGPCP